ncbi:metal-dependent phosphohydrolase [Geotalea daltonii FRC-32]|uniref:Metal-dependent phosphohydrolase n=1 Tax=Geotalea daltonii (strain DSM 22248 / JCM 15807 / FRC-32) TaxID=316067 RepID=B9M7C1_GEODF|nr:HD domain-containing protein [Geotalea daltonii]ACM20209.1 metal-dependent phosphohydrolase [Geotalea daltonii FRC-32]
MTMLEIPLLKAWFAEYCRSFASSDQEKQRNFSLKEYHTHKVCENIRSITLGESLSPEKQDIAEIIALFHDLGRFEQYRRYKTFKDSDSINHAALSADILQEKNVLAALANAERELILKSVRLHNVFSIPQNLTQEEILFLKLIRDADKLDIWRVFIDFYALPETERASAAGLGFPDLPEYSPEVLATLNSRRMVSLSMLKTLNDFKLLQLSWVFDLNFTTSFRILQERAYIDHLSATLPKDERILDAVVTLKTFVHERLT